ERTVETEVRLGRVGEERDPRAQHGEERGLAAPFLLDEAARRLAYDALERGLGGAQAGPGPPPAAGRGRRLGGGLAARVPRAATELATSGTEDEGRIDESHVPAGVAPRVLVARRQQDSPTLIERVDDGLDGVPDGKILDRPMDADTATGFVRHGDHDRTSASCGARRFGAT